eukprot:COSAG01_NODE_1853_length_9060_cov_13.741576_9_plen_73_part_00
MTGTCVTEQVEIYCPTTDVWTVRAPSPANLRYRASDGPSGVRVGAPHITMTTGDEWGKRRGISVTAAVLIMK